MRGSFGPFVFELAKTPSKFKIQQKTKYAEHPRLEGKGVWQWTGHELDVLDMTWRFHTELPSEAGDYTDVEANIAQLQEILLLHEPHPLIMIGGGGDRINGKPYSSLGVFENLYLLESIGTNINRFDKNGIIWAAELQVRLLENIDDGPGVAGEGGGGGLSLGGVLGGFFGGFGGIF